MRTDDAQRMHDEMVAREAERLKAQGYEVLADLADWPKPPLIGGLRPDIYATHPTEKTLIMEIETRDSVQEEKDQQAVFQREAERMSAVFKVKVAVP